MNPKKKKVIRWIVRILILAIFMILAIPGLLPTDINRLFPSLSLIVVMAGLLAQKTWLFGLFWAVPALFIFLLAFKKGRFFCRWICPLGTFYSIFSLFTFKKPLLKTRINGIIFWAIIFAAILGVPLMTFLDPLATLNRIHSFIYGGMITPLMMFFMTVSIFLILGFIQPMIWCTHVCPLGYTFEFSYQGQKKGLHKVNRERRQILTGLFIGVPGAILSRSFGLPGKKEEDYPILPPGAKDQRSFSAICTRCYACVHVCPTRVLKVRFPHDRKLGQFFQPELDFNESYCDEFCRDCSKVCHAGAILPLSLEMKKRRQIGVAKVTREACLAWADGRYCMVCDEFCPYNAIITSMSENQIPRPIVNPELCRGCGSCQYACPAIKMGKAIRVRGMVSQRQIEA